MRTGRLRAAGLAAWLALAAGWPTAARAGENISLPPDITADRVLTDDAVVTVDGTDTGTMSGVISGGYSVTKAGTGTLVLSGANTYTGGTRLASGTIVLGHDQALGTWAAGDVVAANGGVLVPTGSGATIKVNEDRTITNHFQLGDATTNSGTLTFDIAATATLTIDGAEYTGLRGGAITVNVYAAASSADSPLQFAPGSGHLVLSNNSSVNSGGAIGTLFYNHNNQHSVFDFSNLSSLTVTGNTAANADGGGIASQAETSSIVTLGNHVTFSNNYAGLTNTNQHTGGGVSSSGRVSAVTLGDDIVFSDNTAGSGYGVGGGIASYAFVSNVTLGDRIAFTGNIAGMGASCGGWGGGIYSGNVAASTATVKLGNDVTFTGNIAGYASLGYGGGIYSGGPDSPGSTVTLGDRIAFTGNIAGYAGVGAGGGIYSRGADAVVTLGSDVTFTGNIAASGRGYGGGIYSAGSAGPGDATVALGNRVTFTGNIAGNRGSGYGGGIFSGGPSATTEAPPSATTATVTLGSAVYMADNRAGGNNYGGSGGAIYVVSSDSVGVSTLTLHGDTFFSGNLVGSDADASPGSLGGAIYLDGGVGGSVTLATELVATTRDANDKNVYTGTGVYAPIAFAGNKVNVTVTAGVVDTGTGDANAIHLTKNTQLRITGYGNVYFDDPISSGAAGGNSLAKTGAGFVQFVGASTLNASTAAGGEVTVSEGAFRVVAGASFTTGGSDGKKFSVLSDGALAGGGTATSANGFTIAGLLAPDADRFEIPTFVAAGDTANGATATNYNFFLDDKSTVVADAQKVGTLSLVGDVTLNGATLAVDIATSANDLVSVTGAVAFGAAANAVAVTGGTQGATYDVLTASTLAAATGKFGSVTGAGANGYSYNRGSTVQRDATEMILQLTLDSTQNTTLTWTGATDSDWSALAADANWTDGAAGGETRFMAGDAVVFNGAGTASNRTIALAADTTVASMAVSGGEYTFSGASGAKIIGVTAGVQGTLVTPTGLLTVAGAGTVANFAADLDFAGGLTVGDGATMALRAGRAFTSADGTVTLADGSTFIFEADPDTAGAAAFATLSAKTATVASGATLVGKLDVNDLFGGNLSADVLTASDALSVDAGANLAGETAFYAYHFTQNGNALTLSFTPAGATPGQIFQPFAASPNGRSLARSLDAAYAAGNVTFTGELEAALDGLIQAPTAGETAARLQELSPAVLAGGAAISRYAANQFRDGLTNFLHKLRFDPALANVSGATTGASSFAAPDAYAAFAPVGDKSWRFWGEATGSWAEYDSPNADPGYRAKQWGGTVTAFRTFGCEGAFTLGGALAASRTKLDWERHGDRTDGDSFGGALLAAYSRGPWFVAADAVWGSTDVENRRHLPLAGYSAKAEYLTHWYGADVHVGRRFEWCDWTFTPGAGARLYRFDTPGVAETGAGTAGLVMAKSHRTSLEPFARLDVSRTWRLANGLELRPRGFVGVSVETLDRQATTTMNFVDAPVGLPSFKGYGEKAGRVAGLAGLGLDVKVNECVTLYGQYQGEFRDRSQRHAGYLGLGLAF